MDNEQLQTSLKWSERLDKGLKKTIKVLLYLRQNLSNKVNEKVKMCLQIPATADFDVWSPVHPRVSIGLAEIREVSNESTEVDNDQLQT